MKNKKIVSIVYLLITGVAHAFSIAVYHCVNPYAEFLSSSATELPPAIVPQLESQERELVEMARDLQHRVWVALDHRSTLDTAARAIMLDQAIEQIEGFVQRIQQVTPGQTGDPNMGRFLLAPLLGSILSIRDSSSIPPAKINEWIESCRSAVDFQYDQYGKNTDLNWDTRLAGGYPNMDAGYVLVMGLASKLYNDPRYAESAEIFIGYIRENIQPGGSVRYVGDNRAQGLRVNAAPVYTGVVIRFIGSYYTLTGSSAARNLLVLMEPHYPRAWVVPGIPENSTAPWWKHTNYSDRLENAGTFEIIAGAARSSKNKYYADQLVAMGRIKIGDALVAVDFYNPDIPSEKPSEYAIISDPDIDGVRGRFGSFSWVGSLGPVQDTLVGALAVAPRFADGTGLNVAPAGYDCYSLLLVSPEAGLDGHIQPRQPLYRHAAFVTGQDYPGSSMISAESELAVVGAQYRLRQPGIYKPENPETGWRVEQVWLFLEDMLIGRTVMKYEGVLPETSYARLRIRTEPRGALRPGNTLNEYEVGPLRLQVMESGFPRHRYGSAETTDHRTTAPNADEIFLEENEQRQNDYDTSVCLRYGDAPQLSTFFVLSAPGLTGFSAERSSRRYIVWFNQTGEAVQLPTDVGGTIWVSTERAKKVVQQCSTDAPVFIPPYGVACRVIQSEE